MNPPDPVRSTMPPREVARRIAERSAPLWGRLDGPFRPAGDGSGPDARRRLGRWMETAASGNRGRFEERLRRLGIEPGRAGELLGPTLLPPDAELPVWAELLAEVVALIGPGAQDRLEPLPVGVPDKSPSPFQEALSPFVHVARRRLGTKAGPGLDLLTRRAAADLERDLVATLSYQAARALFLEFSLFRVLGRYRGAEATGGGDGLYRAFVRGLLEGRMISLLEEYAVLARSLSLLTLSWTRTVAELLRRLAADSGRIRAAFFDGRPTGRVAAVQPSLSDRHRGGRTVCILEFESGARIVYKPKPLGIDVAYAGLLDWFNRSGAPLSLEPIRTMDRGDYGWCEYIEHLPCRDAAAASRYFRRAGMLICVMLCLDGSDCMDENLIARGEFPCLIDVETLMHQSLRDEAEIGLVPRAEGQARDLIWNSVLRSGLLPSWQVSPDGTIAYDISGLGGRGVKRTEFTTLVWERVNTDAMTVTRKALWVREAANVARLEETDLDPSEFIDEIVSGFEAMYRTVLLHRDRLLAEDGPLRALARAELRFILRPTKLYTAIHKSLLDPQRLRDGADRSIEIDVLSRAYGHEDERFQAFLEAEIRAMEQHDVPYFRTRGDSRDVGLETGRVVPDFFEVSGLARVEARLRAMGEEDLELQRRLIRSALRLGAVGAGHAAEARAGEDESADRPPLPTGELVAEAIRIAEELRAQAIRSSDGSATWIAPVLLIQAGRYALYPLGTDLYSGLCGPVLFLSALGQVTGETRDRDLIRAALRSIEARLAVPPPPGHGASLGVAGLGSVIYALCLAARFLGDESALRLAARAGRGITAAIIAADRHLDVMGGCAGAILGLLTLEREGVLPGAIDSAVRCGRHLLARARIDEHDRCSWQTIGARPLAGFSHGAAGIAYALLRLAAASGEAPYRTAAERAIAWERSLFCDAEGNWPDLRAEPGGPPSFMTAWCHGATGIGLARLAGLPHLDTAAIRREIDLALDATRRHGPDGTDHLCCGHSGRIDFLLAASERLGAAGLRGEALERASRVVRRARRAGSYRLFDRAPAGIFAPGFFQGTSGIGYTLLRLAHPERLPSPLTFA